MKVTAQAIRAGHWWAVTVPEVDGAFTQARRLDQIPTMVADAVQLLDGTPAEDIDVELDIDLGEHQDALHAARRARTQSAAAAAAQDQAADDSRAVVARLRALGLTIRDIAVILDISPQRVWQLENPRRPRAHTTDTRPISSPRRSRAVRTRTYW